MFSFKRKKIAPEIKEKVSAYIVGESENCVNCGKLIDKQKCTASGHTVMFDRNRVINNFCNDYCLRDYGWRFRNGSPWYEGYGLIKFEEPIIC